MAHFRNDNGEISDEPWTDAEKVTVMNDLLTHLPTHPKGLTYAQELLARNPVRNDRLG